MRGSGDFSGERADDIDELTAVSSVSNEFSGTTQAAVQAGTLIGDVVISLPPVPSMPARVPRQVPAADRHFVNRVAELTSLADLAPGSSGGSGAVGILLLTGIRGVGKTALARRAAERIGDQFAGELFVDYTALRSRVGQDAAAGEALAECLRGLGVTDAHMPASTQGRANLFRTCTAAQPILVVLDNVTESRQVRDLLPKARGSVVLATSDHRIGELVQVDGAQLRVVEPLDGMSARQVLIEVCGADRINAEPLAVAELIDLCAGLPMALRMAAARLVVDPALTVGELAAEVGQGLDALSVAGSGGVEGVLDVIYQALPADAGRLYRFCGAVPGLEFTADMAQVLLDASRGDARAALAALRTANLVEDGPRRRSRFFDLVRRHAAAVAERDADPVRMSSALLRLADHYVVQAVFADHSVMGAQRLRFVDYARLTAGRENPFTGNAPAALRWLADERSNLMAVLRMCANRGWHERVWQLAESLAALYLNRRRPYELIDVCEHGAQAAAAVGRLDVQARMHAMASRGHLDLMRLAQARRELDSAISLADQVNNALLRASVWEFQGRYLDEVDRAQAIAAYRRSIELNLLAGGQAGRRGAAISTLFLGSSLDAAGEHEQAITHLHHAWEELRALNDERMAARALVGIGRAYTHLGKDEAAAHALTQAVRVMARLGAAHYEAQALEALAVVAERLGDHEAAQKSLARAVRMLEVTGSARADELRVRLDPSHRQDQTR